MNTKQMAVCGILFLLVSGGGLRAVGPQFGGEQVL